MSGWGSGGGGFGAECWNCLVGWRAFGGIGGKGSFYSDVFVFIIWFFVGGKGRGGECKIGVR